MKNSKACKKRGGKEKVDQVDATDVFADGLAAAVPCSGARRVPNKPDWQPRLNKSERLCHALADSAEEPLKPIAPPRAAHAALVVG